MAHIITELPQEPLPPITALRDIVAVLPDTITPPINVWVGGALARDGVCAGNVQFFIEGEPPNELRQMFCELIAPLGIEATALAVHLRERHQLIRIYSNGKLIIDKATGQVTEIPAPIETPILTASAALSRLPRTVKWKDEIYLTGSLTLRGWSANDADFIAAGESVSNQQLRTMARFFSERIGWPCHCGAGVMPEREPVALYLIYRGGAWQPRT